MHNKPIKQFAPCLRHYARTPSCVGLRLLGRYVLGGIVRKILILIAFLISGCATTDKYVLELGNADELATLYIYRTDTFFHSLNPELPYIYIADKVAAKLGTGEFNVIKVLLGKHRLSVRQPTRAAQLL